MIAGSVTFNVIHPVRGDMRDLTRRDFLRETFQMVLGVSLFSQALWSCTGKFAGSLNPKLNPKETFLYEYDERFLKYWDPVFGPPLRWSSAYGGPSHFQGHIQAGATPGVDYDVPMNTPLVPMMASYLRQATKDKHGSLYILLIHKYRPAYRISYGHLNKIFPDRRYFLQGEVKRAAEEGVRPLMRGQIVALSGNSGMGLLKNRFIHPPHLHVTLYYLNVENRTMAYLNPEKFGLDGGPPVFWDGETDLDVEPQKRIFRLEHTLKDLKEELRHWVGISDLEELRGTLLEYSRLLEGVEGRGILNSKHFLNMRALLKKVTLEEKKFLPGTRPYSLMLKIVGYSMDETQDIILTLPFIAPGLEMGYQKASDAISASVELTETPS